MKFLYKGVAYEARNLNRLSNYMNNGRESTIKTESPLLDSEVVTVYHGIAYLHDVFNILQNGVDGTVPVPRKDKYENLENPKGLFVTPSLKTAAYFAYSGYIIEFNTKVSNLEAPLWNKTDDDDVVNNREGMRLALREKNSQVRELFISQADRPELAATFSRRIEPQALFIGKLAPNQIKAIWYDPSKDLSQPNAGSDSPEGWNRISRQMALKQLKKIDPKDATEIKNIDLGIMPS